MKIQRFWEGILRKKGNTSLPWKLFFVSGNTEVETLFARFCNPSIP